MSGQESNGSGRADGGLTEVLERLASLEPLGRDAARSAMRSLLEGAAAPAEIGAFLMGMRAKGEARGESIEELAGFVEAMRDAALPLDGGPPGAVDLCGTGGDRSGTFNISTAAAFVVAGTGVPVAKHGNRSASSLCGSADVLEALGVPVELPPAQASRALRELGFSFLFAPLYHPAMRHVAGARRALKMRTVFNVLGPLVNPAGVRRQLLGVYDDSLRHLLAAVLAALGSEHVWIVHGDGGLDELSVAGRTRVTEAAAGEMRELEVYPSDAGVGEHSLVALRGGDASRNAEILESVLAGTPGAFRDATILNAAAGLVVAGKAPDLASGAELARRSIDSGASRDLLERLRGFATSSPEAPERRP